jgi:flagellar motility protein MotE (MotC chaperone)
LTGALAIAAIRNIDSAPDAIRQLGAQAQTPSEHKPGEKGDKGGAPEKSDKSAPMPNMTVASAAGATTAAAASAATPAPTACAPSPAELAKEAGLSPGELQTLQNLSSRRGQLDDRERALETQLQLLAAAEAKVDGKLKTLTALKGEISTLLGQADTKVQGEIDRLVIVYAKMKPKDAAAIMSTLDDKVRIPVAAKLKEKDLAAILGAMSTSEAKKITEALASRFNNVKSMAETVQNPPPEPPPPPPGQPPAKGRKPAKPTAKAG